MLKLLTLLLLAGLIPAGRPRPLLDERLCWTNWFDRDNPSGTGDWENLSSLHQDYPGQICTYPISIEAVTVSGNVPATATGQSFITFSPIGGLVCKNVPGKQYCLDYKVRFRCPCGEGLPRGEQ